MAQDAKHLRYDETDTIEYLLYDCKNYSVKIWNMAGGILTKVISRHSGNYIPTIDLSPLQIVYYKPY